MTRKHYIIILLALISVYFLIDIFYIKTRHPSNPVSVTVALSAQKNMAVIYQTIGTVQAYATVDIKSMVTGPIVEVGFKEGEMVQAGQMLFRIDQRSYVAALEQAKATLARDQATLANNQSIVQRNTPLVKKGFVDKQNFATLNATAASMAATVAADQAGVENAEVNLDYTTIKAPITGKTGNISLKLGSTIKANDTLALVSINQINPIYVVFSVPQNKLPIMQKAQKQVPIKITARIGKEVSEIGQLAFIDNTVDMATGTIQMKAIYDNNDQQLWPGQYVTVFIPIENLTHATVVPSLAVQTAQKGFYVYTVDKNAIAHLRYVKVGATVGDETVIEAGILPGEQVVTSGMLRLTDEASVNIITDKK